MTATPQPEPDSVRLARLEADVMGLRAYASTVYTILRLVMEQLKERDQLDQGAVVAELRAIAAATPDPWLRDLETLFANLLDGKKPNATGPDWLRGVIDGGRSEPPVESTKG